MIQNVKDFFWFLKESKSFLDVGYFRMIIFMGGIKKAIGHARCMHNWRKMTEQQRFEWYVNEDRHIEL